MVQQGARHILLLSRRGTLSNTEAGTSRSTSTAEQQAMFDAAVQCVACDVSDYKSLSAALKPMLADMPPVKGVVHAAGVVSDTPISSLSAQQLANELKPKVTGGYNMHALSASCGWQLDFFLAYSSLSGVMGDTNRAAYAASNAALDGLMRYRTQQKHSISGTSLCIQWGPWNEAGMAVRAATEKSARGATLAGLVPLSPQTGTCVCL